jgi:hypothetical protein
VALGVVAGSFLDEKEEVRTASGLLHHGHQTKNVR